jgi:hypothetical protein
MSEESVLLSPFNPADWYWQVAGRSDFWSSAAAAYVEALPQDRLCTTIASEAELSDVLRPYGLRGPAISSSDVNAERDRRIVAGKTINGIAVTGREEDARNLTNLALAAQVRIANGDTATLTTFRDGNNVDHDLTPPEMLDLWQQSSAYVSALYAASWTIKALNPIPADFDANSRWPTVI